MEKQLSFLFVYAFELLVANLYFSDSYEKRFSTKFTYGLGIVLYLLGFVCNYFFNNFVLVNLIVFFIINFVFAILLFKTVSIKDAIFHSAVLLAIMFASEMATDSTLASIFNANYDAYIHSQTYFFAFMVVSKSLYLVIAKILSSIFSKKRAQIMNVKMLTAMFVYPIMSTVLLIMFYYASVLYSFSSVLNYLFIGVSIISLLFSCFIFVIYRNIQVKEYERINLKAEQEKNKINETFYSLLDKKNEEHRRLVHDIKHHIAAINSMDNIDDIKVYLAKIQPDYSKHSFLGKSQNKMLDLILNRYFHMCNTEKIRFSVDVRTANLSFMEDKDLVSMLSNLLDNSIEAAKNCKNSFIEFALQNDESFIRLSLVNSSNVPPKHSGETLFTTKRDSMIHGYGTKSIEHTVKKYNGISQWRYDEKKKEFHYNIIFNKNNKQIIL